MLTYGYNGYQRRSDDHIDRNLVDSDATPVSRNIGIALVLVAAFSWGMYGGIRKHFAPKAHDISFIIVQQLAQFFVTLMIILPQWSTIETSYHFDKFCWVFFAGISTLIAEFMYLAATKHLSSTAAMACQHLPSDCFVSIIIDQFIQSYGVKMKYLLVASSLYLIGEGFFILVDYTYDLAMEEQAAMILEDIEEAKLKSRLLLNNNNISESDSETELHTEEVYSKHNSKQNKFVDISKQDDNQNDNILGSNDTVVSLSGERITIRNLLSKTHSIDEGENMKSGLVSTTSRRRTLSNSNVLNKYIEYNKNGDHNAAMVCDNNDDDDDDEDGVLIPIRSNNVNKMNASTMHVCFWVTVALLGGTILGLFTIMSSIGMTGDGAVTDPGTALLILQTGQTLGLPVVIFIFGYWDPLDMMPAHERITSFSSLLNMTKEETIVAFTVGCFIAGGYAAFYYGTVGVPFAVANGLLASETLVAFTFSAFFWNEYKGTEFFSPVFTYLLLGCVFYIYAVLVLSVLSF